MAFFAKRDRHSSDENTVERFAKAKLKDWINPGDLRSGVSVFGGEEWTRSRIIARFIADCFGQVGVVVLHSGDRMGECLRNFDRLFPEVCNMHRDTPVCFINESNTLYEPFYGMSPERVVEAIYPELSQESPMYLQQHVCAVGLMKYLQILSADSQAFGLADILELCRLPMEQLEQEALRVLPEVQAEDAIAILTQDNLFRQIRADMENYSMRLNGRIWDQNGSPSGVSMIEAAKGGGLLSIQVSGSNVSVLNYLAAELRDLTEKHIPLLLVIDSLQISGSVFGDMLLDMGSSLSMILCGGSIIDLFGGAREEKIRAVQKTRTLLLLQAANAADAAFYSELVGEYLRDFMSENKQKNRGAFDLFSGHGDGQSISQQSYARIRPEEFAQLGEGAVLIDQDSGDVFITGIMEI